MAPRFSTELEDQTFEASSSEPSFTYTLPMVIDEDSSSVSVTITSGFDSTFMSFEDMNTIRFTNIS